MNTNKKNYNEYPIDKGAGSLNSLKGTDDLIKLRDTSILFDFKDTDNRYQIGCTVLYPGCRTGGHIHDNAEEIYHIIDGHGKQKIDEEEFDIIPGDTFIVPATKNHITINPGCIPLKYYWIVVNK